ncbi:MAG: DUF4381 family protein [Propionibacterium sp.]|nr:DUF4381 family protein [Propionibacterium sp.]
MPLEIPPIHPVVDYPPHWWALVAACALAALLVLALGILRWRALRPAPIAADTSLDRLRTAALGQLRDDAAHDDPQAACRAMSRTVRRFVGTASDGDADYSSPAQLRAAARIDPRLGPVAALVTDMQEACFAPSASPDVGAFGARSEEVVASWR